MRIGDYIWRQLLKGFVTLVLRDKPFEELKVWVQQAFPGSQLIQDDEQCSHM